MYFFGKHRGDVEPVDQKKYLEDSCKPKCVRPLIEYQACVKRVEGDDSGEKHCTGQYFDYWHCIDKAKYGSPLSSFVRLRLQTLGRAEEEPVDQKKYFEDLCKPKCVRAWLEYQGCVKRVEADESGHKHCTGQYFDYWRCVDKCVAPKLFKKLK
ncbi:hypothetical protein Ccrd_010625 [Cynara cardunculus var. scolymus]|uniref:Complex III subunit VI n=1 Tax=Cynara cardunculus var. scolymus TaxID=59895 RepID=A0A103YKZ7_CYNCS|nr:hypothetical protein Ccrd_010625 [Cynara cardunculus var. scolymus]